MASVPCTLVIFTEDKVNFPPKDVLVFMKQLFKYGVKNISLKEGKVFINLSYSPRAETLKRKFQQLPLKYIRSKMENMEEFKVVERIVKRYGYNFVDEDQDEVRRQVSKTSVRYIEPLSLDFTDMLENENENENAHENENKTNNDVATTSK